MPRVLVSDAILEERFVIEADQDQDPAPSGWKALSALYAASLAACGYAVARILRPDIYQTDIARRVLGVTPGDWHLAVKPIEHLRPFHGIPNVFVCDWPFPDLSAAPVGHSPFFDQLRLLRMADAVWCCTDFTTATLRRAGVEHAMTLPPHIPPPEGASPLHPPAARRFLSVVDAARLSRQLGPTIAGFAGAARHQDGLSLVICLQGADAPMLADLRQDVAETLAKAETDVLIAIEGAETDSLYAAADAFLCAHAAPGLHPPLVRAMHAGLPIVSTMTAGTAAYLPAEAAIAIPARPAPLDPEEEPIARFLPLAAHPPSADALRDAVLTAARLDRETRRRMGALGREAAARRFSLGAFRAGLAPVADRLSAGRP